MKFVFEYKLGDAIERIEVTLSDAVIQRAQEFGYELAGVEAIAKSMIDKFFYRATGTDFWHQTGRLNNGCS